MDTVLILANSTVADVYKQFDAQYVAVRLNEHGASYSIQSGLTQFLGTTHPQ